ncbi:uncharacterized protein LOC136040318 [Artemia franciscana]|uniref:Endonuclease/exonuclease/phosphatase domain-containing protein n=1 Tax=Artemia franciscana TaxID=6661 RepID=A0AA88HV91_ARTSF|nr:hypothetical protein QYM36_008949 [Artemia franciscana]
MEFHSKHGSSVGEIRWTGRGLEKFDDGYTIAYSEDPSIHRPGVGVIMSSSANWAMASWNSVNERLMRVSCVSNHTKLTIITCYATTNEADNNKKDTFCDMLQAVTKYVPSHDILCVTGDLNAKIGMDRQHCPQVLDCHDIEEINENGVLLVDYALSNGLVISGTFFKHKTIYKCTWMSPIGEQEIKSITS